MLQQRRAHHGDHPAQARRDPPRGQVHGVRLVEPALPARDRRPGRGRAGRLGLHRLGRPRRRAARVPRRVLGQGRPRDRRRPAAAAGAAVLPLPGAAGRRAGRAPGDRRQGPHRAGLRRALLLGRRDLRAAGVHVHPARAAADALRWRHSTLDLAYAHAGPGPRGRGVRLADDQRRGVLGLLARGHRRVPRQRRHRRRRHALRRGHRRRRVRARGRRRPAGGDRPAVALAGPPRQDGRSASTASPGPTSTPLWPTTTSTRTSWRRRTCGGAADAAVRHPARPAAARLRRGDRELARRGERDGRSPTTRRSACTSRARASPATRCGTSRTPRRRLPAAAQLPVLRPVPQAGRQAARPGPRHGPARGRVHPEQKHATSSTTSGSPSGTRRSRPARWP